MRHTIYLLAAIATLSLAACSKSSNSATSITPASSMAYFKGDMNDSKITVYSIAGNSFSMQYKGGVYSATMAYAERDSATQEEAYYVTVYSFGKIAATGMLHTAAYPFPANYAWHTQPYMEFNPGSIFESKTYTMSAN